MEWADKHLSEIITVILAMSSFGYWAFKSILKSEIDESAVKTKISGVARSVNVLADSVSNIKTDVRRIGDTHVNDEKLEKEIGEVRIEIERIESQLTMISDRFIKDMAADDAGDRQVEKDVHQHSEKIKELEIKLSKTNERFIILTTTLKMTGEKLDAVARRIETRASKESLDTLNSLFEQSIFMSKK